MLVSVTGKSICHLVTMIPPVFLEGKKKKKALACSKFLGHGVDYSGAFYLSRGDALGLEHNHTHTDTQNGRHTMNQITGESFFRAVCVCVWACVHVSYGAREQQQKKNHIS